MTGTIVEQPRTRFPAPDDVTAVAPAEARGLARDAIRLLVGRPGDVRHARFRDLPDALEPGDLVVVNNSAVRAAQVDGRRRDGARVVVHLATDLGPGDWVVELRTAPDARRAVLDAASDDVVLLGPTGAVSVHLLAPHAGDESSPSGRGNRLWRARVGGDLRSLLIRHGRPIAYGYLDRRYPLAAYQSVFSTVPGSAESPSAGRPFTETLVTRLVSRGVGVAPITLHTGVSSQEAGEAPQAEWYDVPEATARLVNAARAGGGRVVAVGTTVTRALESAVDGGRVVASSGWTDRLVTPGHPPEVVTGLVTGWHDPQASHLLLVEAVAGAELTQAAYDAAVAEGYAWHEFGDAALLLP